MSKPEPMTAMVRAPHFRAAALTIVSTPRANPLTIVMEWRAISWVRFSATEWPYGLG